MTANSSYNEFIELQSRYPRKIGNDFMVPAEIRKRLEQGNLSFIANEQALFMFEQREGFCKLHFRLADIAAKLPPHDGMLAAYLTFREGRYPNAAADWLRGQGFKYSKTLQRHTAKEVSGDISNESIEKAPADEVYSMLGGYFSVVEADLPPRELFETGDTYCKRSPEGELLGIVYDMGQTRIVAVSEEARGQGLGRRLYLAYAKEKTQENKGNIFHEWVSPDNGSSKTMFRSIGFAPDTTMTDCFITS